ncbi:hypothetical protein HpEKB14_14860 [Helicobacter pylori]
MSNLQELREHLKELENSFEIGSFTKENIKEYAKCFFMSLSMFLEEQEKNQQEEFLEQDTKENQEELIKSIQTSIAKNQELEKISFEKWENKIQERVLPKLKRIVTHKLQESITSSINTQLESFKKDELDLSSVFEIQRKNTQIAYRLAIGGLIGIIALSIAIFIMMPLKENTPYFIDFANSDKHFAVVQRADTNYDKQDLLFKIKNEYFKCSVKGLKSAGFLAMFSKKELENDESNDDKDNKEKEQNAQFNLKIDDVLSLNDLVLATIKRNAPSPYKEADFVKLLENKGIGRPSTYASYLPTLVKREYISISQDKKHIITPTHKGKRVVEVFENAYQFIIDLTYTKQMEEVLDEIVENKSSYVDFISNLNSKCPKIEKLERNDDEIKPSSEGQITYIENILRDLQLNLSEEFKNYKEDNRVAKAFLDRYIKEHEFFKKNNKKASSSNNDENRPATPKQISFAEMLAKKHNVKLPKGFKYSMKVCGDFINEYHKK